MKNTLKHIGFALTTGSLLLALGVVGNKANASQLAKCEFTNQITETRKSVETYDCTVIGGGGRELVVLHNEENTEITLTTKGGKVGQYCQQTRCMPVDIDFYNNATDYVNRTDGFKLTISAH